MSSKMSRVERINNIEEIRHEILNMQLSRLIVFGDFIDRYLHLRLKENYSWLRVDTILSLITRGENLTPSQLAKLMLRSRNSITKLINGLQSDGLIKRVHSDKDHRIVNIEVTSKGLEFTMTNLKKLSSLEEELRDCLDGDELSVLVGLTRKLRLKLIENLTGLKSEPDKYLS
jgi:MarR family transcriptional regulator, negative regulator of the multidrug operon emrRAB